MFNISVTGRRLWGEKTLSHVFIHESANSFPVCWADDTSNVYFFLCNNSPSISWSLYFAKHTVELEREVIWNDAKITESFEFGSQSFCFPPLGQKPICFKGWHSVTVSSLPPYSSPELFWELSLWMKLSCDICLNRNPLGIAHDVVSFVMLDLVSFLEILLKVTFLGCLAWALSIIFPVSPSPTCSLLILLFLVHVTSPIKFCADAGPSPHSPVVTK